MSPDMTDTTTFSTEGSRAVSLSTTAATSTSSTKNDGSVRAMMSKLQTRLPPPPDGETRVN